MKSKKKIIIISAAFFICAIIALICLCLWGYISLSMKADELSMDTNWKQDITYSMLSEKLKNVISEEEFNDRTDI